jgi:hypothetical protein
MAGDTTWLTLLGAALGGGFTVKVLDIIYQEFRHRSDRKRAARQFVDQHLDPLLKATDEVVGKLRSLAEEDFVELRDRNPKAGTLHPNFASLLYLFARFWAQVELLRRQGLSIAMGEDKRGKKLQNFLDCLESRKVRIVDRSTQRAIAEVMLPGEFATNGPMSFVQFVKTYETSEDFRRWLRPLVAVLSRTRHTRERQQLLQYGVVLHALIDTLDGRHTVTRERPSFPNKLTRQSWQDLRYRVFGRYLTFVEDRRKYLGPPKRRSHGQS